MQFKPLLPLGVVAAAACLACVKAGGAAPANPIQAENLDPGTRQGAVPSTTAGNAIAGYASEISAVPGATLHLHVSTTPAAPYRVEIYRLGWYGGTGARMIGCVPSCSGFRAGQQLPVPSPDANGLVRSDWPVTDTFALPTTATTGYYRVRFVLADGRGSSSYVIVRPTPGGHHASILVQVPVNTWQAYNTWGGRSLYTIAGQAFQGNRVSFDRPTNGNGLGWEYPLVLFLEREGYDVDYQTDVETDADPSSLLGYRLVIVNGHSEYWTSTMRNAFEAARDAGVNLAFIGANDAYWQVRYEDDHHTIVGYKSTADPIADPSLQTVLFRAMTPPQPECELMGIQHQGGALNWPGGDYTIVPDALDNPWFDGTGFDASSTVKGVVGVETDTIPSNMTQHDSCGNDLTVFFHRELGGDILGNADATAYTAPSGAIVFDAGSKWFEWGLADGSSLSGLGGGLVDPRLQRFVMNMLNDLSATRSADLTVSGSQSNGDGGSNAVKMVVVVANNGPDPVRRATLTLTLPPGLSFVRVAGIGMRCTRIPVQCALSQFEPDTAIRAVFTFRSTVRRTVAVQARIVAMAITDPRPATEFARVRIRAKPPGR